MLLCCCAGFILKEQDKIIKINEQMTKMTDIQSSSSYSSVFDFRDTQLPEAFLISDGSKA
jgi:hypothetical protein